MLLHEMSEGFYKFWREICDFGWDHSEDLAAEAWRAGRESMREEAALLVASKYDEMEPWIEPDEIRKIKP